MTEYAHFVGRIGGLAAALGVGIALTAATPAVVHADTGSASSPTNYSRPRSNVSVYCAGAVTHDCSDAGGLRGARGAANGRPEVSAPCVRGGRHFCCGGRHVLVHSVDAGACNDFSHPDLVGYQCLRLW